MRLTYKYRLYPTREQKQHIQFTLERCRLLYNRLLEERIIAYKTEGNSLNYYDQANTFKERKQHIPALKQVYSQVLQDTAKRLHKAFQAFFRRVKSGEKPGFPRFKPQQKYDSFAYPQGGYALQGNKLRLSKIGEVKIKLHRQIEGKIKTCTITVKNGKYYACFSCDVQRQELPSTLEQVGVDLGLKHLATTSEGGTFEAPKHLKQNERKLKELQRAVSRKQRRSNRRVKAVHRLARLHEKVANSRKDHAHKVSWQLVSRYGLIAFENLNVRGLIRNHHLAKSIADAGWSQLVQFTTYKAESAGRVVVQVDPRNTSQQCSNCGAIVKKSLAVRIHRCNHCNYEADRDENAARNILQRALVS
ncbi:RNA-guided endonuclease InsQ/TnpB family protein [Paenibacillus cremeus]|uniref:IS200/IS605 family element transposase accessory protein TnpB n=1 Tax=Paenibacillus cremeus TaxID=2163881 RepID=A0A559JHS7_9BACL|nr:RNA-guided endonuclease TnpB family protein [Paenibacillus cremeus]TVX99431.1 IS200/IS605 family element transposase accessory protein TnpB [Paenibacillus cremeus]